MTQISAEVIAIDFAAAERRAERITLRLEAIADNYNAVLPMIREAIEKRDDMALGYRSPGEYVADRFGQSLAGLGVDVRRAVVGELTQAGLSTRAIAPIVGVHHDTVARDRQAGVVDTTPDQTPEPAACGEAVQGPGRTPEGEVAPALGDEQATTQEQDCDTPRPPVTGIDGKTYRPSSKPLAPRRRPLPDAFFDAAYDLGKAAERVSRLGDDDRFPQNADHVAARHRNDLIRSRDLLDQVIQKLNDQEYTHD